MLGPQEAPDQYPADHGEGHEGRGHGRGSDQQVIHVPEQAPESVGLLTKMTGRPGDHADESEHECGGAGRADPQRKSGPHPCGCPVDGQVRDERVELAVRPRSGELDEPLLQLVRTDPPLDGRVAQALRDPLPIGI